MYHTIKDSISFPVTIGSAFCDGILEAADAVNWDKSFEADTGTYLCVRGSFFGTERPSSFFLV